MKKVPHVPVLYREVLDLFAELKSGTIVDCTLGYGGHSELLLNSNPDINIIGIDQDIEAIEYSKTRLAKFGDRVKIINSRASEALLDILDHGGDSICGILADIGVSSLQLDQNQRGFSYSSDSLDMRMDQTRTLSAKDVVNSYTQGDLERVLKEYGEIRNYKKVAQAILEHRDFDSALALSEVVKPYAPYGKKIHPATLVMQAIRIEVNDELGELKRVLETLQHSRLDLRVAIISFHSLEDRIVKQTFASWAKSCICSSEAMRCECGGNNAIGTMVQKRPFTAKDDELKANIRSRSAKLRAFDLRST